MMTLYGHDNLSNSLPEDHPPDCKLFIMNHLKPDRSQLYHNGAINGVRYSGNQIFRGQQIGENCLSRYQAMVTVNGDAASRLFDLCNDSHTVYQADYYHSIAAAFMGCRGQIAFNQTNALAQGLALGTIPNLINASTSSARQLAIRAYKLARFREEINSAPIQEAMKTYLLHALQKIALNSNPFDSDWVAYKRTVNEPTWRMVEAIVNRYRHEVQYRIYQNNVGATFGERSCQQQDYLLSADAPPLPAVQPTRIIDYNAPDAGVPYPQPSPSPSPGPTQQR
jgi:hypothetical protein